MIRFCKATPFCASLLALLDIKLVAPDGRQARQFPTQKLEFNHHQPGQNFSPTLSAAM